MKLYAGTSGYSYKEWKGTFYPQKFSEKDMLGFYAKHFPSVEINATFYRMPKPEMLEKWAGDVPDGFVFVLKLSQRITHQKRLKDVKDSVDYFVDTAKKLGPRLGPVLVQLPPNFKRDDERLRGFLELVPAELPLAFEFRHASWHVPEVQDILRSRNAALCLSDSEEEEDEEEGEGGEEDPPAWQQKPPRVFPPIVPTADWGYLRLRRCDYTAPELVDWAKNIHAQPWKTAYVFFKHEDEGTGPSLATDFIRAFG